MSDLFVKNDEENIENIEDYEEEAVDAELSALPPSSLDARRRLENKLEEKRLRDELSDLDY